MMRYWWIALVCTSLWARVAPGTEFALYYLGGQSNMDGYGQVSDLTEKQRQAVPSVFIFHGNTSPDRATVDGRGRWSPLRPGHGVGFRSDGKQNHYSERFGVELTFARRLRELHPDRPVALIKYSRGGTSIDARAARHFGCWEPDYRDGKGQGAGVNQYDHFLATVRNAYQVRDIDGDGTEDRLVPMGIVWMQGESDASINREVAEAYGKHLKRLMDLVRASLHQDDLPVAIGRISDSGTEPDGKVWDYGEAVRNAQQAYVDADPAAVLVTSTDDYGYSDPWHYDSAGYLDLGKQFADGLQRLMRRP